MVVTDLLLESFSDLFDVTYTARMEAELDEIEEGKIDWRVAMSRVLRAVHRRTWNTPSAHMTDIKRMEEPTDQICEKCGKPMVIKWGRHGKFIACTGYPECTNTRELPADRRMRASVSEQDAAEYVRQLRASDGAEEGALRAVLGVHAAIRIARRPSSWARRSSRKTCRSKRSARSAAINLVQEVSDATASSWRAAIIRPANSSSRRPSA